MKRYTKNEVLIVSRKNKYSGFFSIDEIVLKHKLFDGSTSQEIKRELISRGKTAGVLLYDEEQDKVALIEQFRLGAIEHHPHPWLYEIVLGYIDNNDSPSDTVKREALEEANVKINKLIPMHSFMVGPGGSDGICHLFLGLCNITEDTVGVYGLEDENEDIKVHVFTREEAYAMLESGEINNATTMLALQWLELNKGKI